MDNKKFRVPTNKVLDGNEYFTNKASIHWNSQSRNRVIQLCKDKNSVIDIGAHIGITTLHWLAEGFNQVHAFEINPSHYDCLVENTLEYKDRINYYSYGCGKETAQVYGGYKSRKNSGTFTIIDKHLLSTWRADEIFEIDIKPLDTHQFDSVSLIKIDVEGWELEVLQGSLDTIQTHQPLLFIEYGHGNHHKILHKYDDKVFQTLMSDLNYIEYEVVGADAQGHGDSIFMPKNYFG